MRRAWLCIMALSITLYVSVKEGSVLNARFEPSKNSSIEMRLKNGGSVEVLQIADGWAEIVGGEGGTSWCAAAYLWDGIGGEREISSNGRVKVRDEPGDGEVIRYVKNGSKVKPRFIFDGWAFLGDGYIDAGYLGT